MPKISELHVNGKSYPIDAEPDASLLFVLRDQLDLTGSKYGCGEGMCGACTVWVDGTPRRSCITGVGSVAGKQITTIEGLATNGRLHPLQQAFVDVESFQCAYCTSGMIMSGAALLRTNPNPNEAEIVRYMQGNVCRCGTHPRIVEAIRRASHAMRIGQAISAGRVHVRGVKGRILVSGQSEELKDLSVGFPPSRE